MKKDRILGPKQGGAVGGANSDAGSRLLDQALLYHGTNSLAVHSIMAGGFKIGQVTSGRERGRGLYLSDLAGAVQWGDYVVKCRVDPGTRVVRVSKPDVRVVEGLRNEFGGQILSPEFRKALPKNKHLTAKQSVALYCHLVRSGLERRWGGRNRLKVWETLWRRFDVLHQELRSHRYHAIRIDFPAAPEVVVFNPSRVQAVSVHRWTLKSGVDIDEFWESEPRPHSSVLLGRALSLPELRAIQSAAEAQADAEDEVDSGGSLVVPPDKRILFHRRDQETFGFLSNFHPAPIIIDGDLWPTVEHYYQAQKAFDVDYRTAVRQAPTPGQAKRMARSWFRMTGREPGADWDTVKLEVMRRALHAKFHQHPELADKLIATRMAALVEDSPADAFWGAGPAGDGLNWLGRLLAEVRAELGTRS